MQQLFIASHSTSNLCIISLFQLLLPAIHRYILVMERIRVVYYDHGISDESYSIMACLESALHNYLILCHIEFSGQHNQCTYARGMGRLEIQPFLYSDWMYFQRHAIYSNITCSLAFWVPAISQTLYPSTHSFFDSFDVSISHSVIKIDNDIFIALFI